MYSIYTFTVCSVPNPMGWGKGWGKVTLQDFTVLPTETFRRCVIRSSSVIYLPTSSPTDRTDGFCPSALPSSVIPHSVAIWFGKTKKTICWWFYRRNLHAKKKRFPLEIYRWIFISSVISWFTNGYVPSVKLLVSVWNIDRIYTSVNSSVSVATTVKYRRIKSVGKAVGKCLEYRLNISICKCVAECYCQMSTDSFCR